MNTVTTKTENVVTRFAPSPTGFMHVGSVRTALFAWAFARKNNGKFILRIEDTDKDREVEGSIDHIKKSLLWLELDWDYGPDKGGPEKSYIQSERLSIYIEYAKKLIDLGFAYSDPYSEEKLEAFRVQAEAEKRPFLYRDHRPLNPKPWDGSTSLRFKIQQPKRMEWKDVVWGDLSAGPEALDDFILIKSDGFPTYNFAHIVDDIEMKVTHVMRGQEFISSTPKFLAVYEAFGMVPPVYATLPPIMAPDGKKKLGKRDGAKDILEYKSEGFLPDAMLNFLAFLGWNPGTEKEIFSRSDLVREFSLEKIQHSGAQFNEEKLNWTNKEHLKLLDSSIITAEISDRLKNSANLSSSSRIDDVEFMAKVTPLILERISKWGDIDTLISEGDLIYFFEAPNVDLEKINWKDEPIVSNTKEYLLQVVELLKNAPYEAFNSIESIKELIFSYATEKGRGNVLWPTRYALSGKEKSPDPFTLVYCLGKEEAISRLENTALRI